MNGPPVDAHRLEVRTKQNGNVELYAFDGRCIEMTREEAESVGIRMIRASAMYARYR